MNKLAAFSHSAADLAQAVTTGDLQPRDVVDFYGKRATGIGKTLNAFIDFDQDSVAQQLSVLEKRLESGESMRLAGVPIAIKDNICVEGVQTTCASQILAKFKPVYDATVISRLRDAGALLFGKANCDEFAMGSSNENSSFGPVKNPWDLGRVPGGSSGGSAAVVAADCAPVSLGSDTGGSIRQPASLCGVVGLKPTYGRVSRYGLVAFGSSLDQIGPFSRTVADAALIHDVISGHDPRDSTSLNLPPDSCSQSLQGDTTAQVGKMRIGIVKEFFGDGIDPDVRAVIEAAITTYRNMGAELIEVSLPHLKYSLASYYILSTAEASANLARFDGVRYGFRASGTFDNLRAMYEQTRSQGFGREVKQRIMLGTFALSSGYYDAYYGTANKARALIAQDFTEAFKKVDLLLSPVSPTTAFKIGEKSDDPLALYLSDICTIGVNLAGIPAISVPAGFDPDGLPVGLQILAPWQQEKRLFIGAHAYEQATRWWQQRTPKLQ